MPLHCSDLLIRIESPLRAGESVLLARTASASALRDGRGDPNHSLALGGLESLLRLRLTLIEGDDNGLAVGHQFGCLVFHTDQGLMVRDRGRASTLGLLYHAHYHVALLRILEGKSARTALGRLIRCSVIEPSLLALMAVMTHQHHMCLIQLLLLFVAEIAVSLLAKLNLTQGVSSLVRGCRPYKTVSHAEIDMVLVVLHSQL